ncbi:MAG: T9SS type A sorting domain-containing protein [Ignavibacteria bacterium]|nr:T9SS type A sorting domain-containing protein [Ignavibacteria bacterium]
MKRLTCFVLLLISTNLFAQGEPPWRRPLKICTSSDGQSFTNVRTFQDSAGVPCILRLQSGMLISAFQWFRQPVGSATWDRVAVKYSSDNGITWTEPQPITVNGLPQNFQRPFDPTLAITDDGRIRIFFSSGLNMTLDTSINTYSAVSDDGINYSMDSGFRFSLPDKPVIDPAVIRFRGMWHLVNPVTMGTGAYHNISGDGLNFTRVQDIASDMAHSWIGNFMIRDTNELRFYGSGGMIWYSTSPNGGQWSSFINTNIQGGDPAALKLPETNYLMIYTGPPYPSAIGESGSNPEEFSLGQNYPNPFNPTTKINYKIQVASYIELKVFDALGKDVATLVNEMKIAGSYEVEFNASKLPSGVYFYSLIANGKQMSVKRMALVR